MEQREKVESNKVKMLVVRNSSNCFAILTMAVAMSTHGEMREYICNTKRDFGSWLCVSEDILALSVSHHIFQRRIRIRYYMTGLEKNPESVSLVNA